MMRWKGEVDLPRRWSARAPAWLIETLVVVILSSVALAARAVIDSIAPDVAPFALIFPAVVAATLLAGRRAGLVTTLICQVASWRLLQPVKGSSGLGGPGGAFSLLLSTGTDFFLVWATDYATSAGRRANEALVEQSRLAETNAKQRLRIELTQETVGAIFTRSAEGMTLCKLVRDEAGLAVDYVILDSNPAHAAMVDVPREKMVGVLVSTIAPPMNPRWLTTAEAAVRTLQPQHFEVFSAPNGRWLDVRVSPVAGDHFSQTFIDVTERKAAEEARDRSAELLRTFLQAVPGVVYAKGREGRMLVANQGVVDLVGKPAEAIIGRTDAEFLDDKAQAAVVMATDRRIMESGVAEVLEEEVALPDGRPAIWLSTKTPLRDANGEVVGLIGSSIDFTQQAEARAIVARSREELEREVSLRTEERDRLWRNSQDLLMVARFDTTIISVNPAWTRVLGWAEAELVGHRFMDLIHPDDLEDSRREAEALGGEGRSTMHYQNRYRAKDGSWRWLSWAVTSESGLFHAVARDVTAEREAVDALRQAQKMEAVGQLTGGIAHDFNNMLAVVIGSLDLLQRRIGDDPAPRRYVDAAADAAHRAAALTQRLLAFSRRQPLKPEVVEINKLVSGMSELLAHTLGHVRVVTVLAPDLWRTHVDPNQLENVVLNLAVNARDAMGEGGRIVIETGNVTLDERAAAHAGVAAGDYVQLQVTDNGVGMPPEVLARAFEPFFTTKEVGKGTGLGLSQVYGYVSQSGGHVKVYSEVNQGTTVKVYLPRRVEGEARPVDVAPAALGSRARQGEVVLVVEDEPSVRRFSVEALTELGYGVLEADGAAGALDILRGPTDVSLMFTDVVMPEVNGARLADRALELRPGLRVLFTTGYASRSVVENDLLAPHVRVIGKPFAIDDLAAEVRSLLDG